MPNGHGDKLEIISTESASPMALDTVKALFTYFIVATVVIGGGIMLFIMRTDPPETGSATLSLAVVGFIGGALSFLFGQEVQTRTARQAASQQAATTAASAATTAAAQGAPHPSSPPAADPDDG